MRLTSSALSGLPGLSHGFFTREGGVSGGVYGSLNGGLGSSDSREAVLENRRRMAERLGVGPECFLSLYQIHSPDVVVVDEPWDPLAPPRADALVTRVPGIAVAAASADCAPVLFADSHAGVVGAAHAGWKGAFIGVLEATVERMEALGASRRRIVAAIGPTIGREAYEVGPEFVARFLEADAGNRRFFAASQRGQGHAMFDLPAYVAARLESLGLADIEDLGRCTYSDEASFFSYRRATHRGEPDYGRHLSAIALQP
jgi:YfiH family protein